MRSTHWLTYAGALGFLLGSAGQFTLRADEAAEARAIRLIEETGGTVTRDEHAAGKPVIGVSLCGAKLTDDAVKCLSAFPQLRSLDLCRTQGLNWRRIKYLADVKGLESLNMSRCNDIVIGALYHLAALKNLRSLDVSYCDEINDSILANLVEYFPRLQFLGIAGCKPITAKGLKELHVMKRLDSLNVSHCDFTDAEVKEISRMIDLRSLAIAGNPRVTVNGLKTLATLENLEVLDMSNSSAVASASIKAIGELKKLHTLNISNCPRLSSHSLSGLSTLKQLRTLNLAYTEIEDYGLEYLVELLPQLRSLDISGCAYITDAGMKELARLGHLETLNVRQCRKVSDNGARTVIAAFPKLKLDR